MKSKYPALLVAGLGGLFTVVNLASAQGWTATGAPALYWRTVTCSADGVKLVATGGRPWGGGWWTPLRLPIYTSADSGVTWTQTSAPSNNWSAVASSADGTKLVAVVGRSLVADTILGPIYSSADSGVTWTQTSAPSNYWSCVASSADGTKLVAAAETIYGHDVEGYIGGLIYSSTNAGITWTQTSAPSNHWSSVASSADGTKLVAATYSLDPYTGGQFRGSVYFSMDSGANWTQTSAPSNYWSSVASSADGVKLVAAGGSIYTSTNSGDSWTQTGAPSSNYWTSVASSANGTKLVAVSTRDSTGDLPSIHTSTNSGVTWTQTSVPSAYGSHWSSVASSADGSKLVLRQS